MLSNEPLHQATLMNGMVVPNQDDIARELAKQLLQKGNHLLASQAMAIRANGQFELMSTGQYNHSTQKVETFMMVQTGSNGRRLSTRRPGTLERRNQREATFIFKHQRGSQFTPLFLSWAKHSVSSAALFCHLAALPLVGDIDYSIPSDPEYATRYLDDSGSQTCPRSNGLCDPRSSNLLRTHVRRRLATTPALTPVIARQINGMDDPVDDSGFYPSGSRPPFASSVYFDR